MFALKTGVLIFLNGEFVPEERAVVSVFDRGFLYGDGLFETMRVYDGRPFRWRQHLERLLAGAEFLGIKSPYPPEALRDFADQLIAKNQLPESLLRINLSRGVGRRGYSPKGADAPTVVMSLHPVPSHPRSSAGGGAGDGGAPLWKVITSSHRLPAGESLAQFKTCNKLAQILARAEADAAGADEALLLNTDGFVVEGASSNLFWIEGETVCTPPLESGVLPGVTRAVVWEICDKLGLQKREANITADQLKKSDGVFVSLSSVGIAEVMANDGENCGRSPVVAKIFHAYFTMTQETSSDW